MSSKSLFSQKALSNVKKAHKAFLWVATMIMIISLLLGVVLIFTDTENEMFGKIQGTFFILAVAVFICVNNFIRIEKGNRAIQGFALTGFLANIVWLVLGILMIWGVLSPVQVENSSRRTDDFTTPTYNLQDKYDEYNYDDEEEDYTLYNYDEIYSDDEDYLTEDYYYDLDDYDYYNDYSNYEMDDVYRDITYPSSYTSGAYNISIAAKIIIVAVGIASIGFWVSNILVIKDKIKAIKPLKTTAIICQVYSSTFIIVLAFAWPININQDLLKWVELYGLSISGFIITALAAWIISRTHKEVDLTIPVDKPRIDEPVTITEDIKEEIITEEPKKVADREYKDVKNEAIENEDVKNEDISNEYVEDEYIESEGIKSEDFKNNNVEEYVVETPENDTTPEEYQTPEDDNRY